MPLGIGIDLLKKVSIGNYDGILIFFIREATTLWQNRIKRCSISEIRENYIDGAWNKEDESEWLTEIQVPVKKQFEVIGAGNDVDN